MEAFHSGVNVTPVFPENGKCCGMNRKRYRVSVFSHHPTWEDIGPRIFSGADDHIAPTRVISLENTLNGTVIPQDDNIEACTRKGNHYTP